MPFLSCYYTKTLSISCPCAAVSLHYLHVYDMPFRRDAHISHICLREKQQPASSDMVLLEDIGVALHLALCPACHKTATNTHIQEEILLTLPPPLLLIGTHKHLGSIPTSKMIKINLHLMKTSYLSRKSETSRSAVKQRSFK